MEMIPFSTHILKPLQPYQTWLSRIWMCGVLVFCSLVLGWQTVGYANGDTPDLPAALKKSHRPALVEFYAQWCGSCQRVHPYVERMIQQAGGKVDWIRLDVDEASMQAYARQYHIVGTPTFILFNASGHPTFRMEGATSVSLLRMLIAQSYDAIPAHPLPNTIHPERHGKALASHTLSDAPPYTVVRFASPGCHTDICQQDDRYFSALTTHLSKQVGRHIQWVSLQPDAGVELKYLQSLISRRKPYRPSAGRYYVLLNRKSIPLMRINQPLNPKWQHSLLTVLQLMLNGERGGA